jgi:hypothetical protein
MYVCVYNNALQCFYNLRKSLSLPPSSKWSFHQAQNALQLHFLAGRSFGPFVLLMTIIATSSSGYSVVGVPASGDGV